MASDTGVRTDTIVEAAKNVVMVLRGFNKDHRERILEVAGILLEVEDVERRNMVVTEAHEKQ